MRLVIIILLLAAVPSHGAYRLYKLRVRHLDETGKTKKKETVESTLDPVQYESYHGHHWIKVELIDSWYCPGDTSWKKYCSKPKEPQRLPASMEREKRLPINRQPVIP